MGILEFSSIFCFPVMKHYTQKSHKRSYHQDDASLSIQCCKLNLYTRCLFCLWKIGDNQSPFLHHSSNPKADTSYLTVSWFPKSKKKIKSFWLTGLCKIWVTRFLCSIILKSCRRSGDMFLSLMYSGSFSLMRSKYLSLWGMLGGGGVVTTPWLASELMLHVCCVSFLSALINTK